MEVLIGALIVAVIALVALSKKKPTPPTPPTPIPPTPIPPTPDINLYTCQICGIVFYTAESYARHMAEVHGREIPPSPIPPTEYVCPIDGESFLTQSELDTHMSVAHGGIIPPPPPAPKEGDKKCDGYTLWVVYHGKWTVQRYNSPECGYVAPPEPIPPPKPGTEETMIKGFVRQRYTSDGISGAKIEIMNTLKTKVLTTCFTDTNGNFLTNPISTPMYPTVTAYAIVASADGYKSLQNGFEITGTRAGAGQIFQLVQSLVLERIGIGIPPGWEVAGTVESTTGKDLYGARVIWKGVTLEGGKYVPTGVIYTARTKSYGMYELPLIVPGIYIPTVEATGYITYGGGVTRVEPPFSDRPYTYMFFYHLTPL